MTGRLLKMGLVVVALVVTTSPAWAGTPSSCCGCWKIYAKGVDCHGCLTDCGGSCGCFYYCLNCCTGCYTGKACGDPCSVKNCTGCGPLCYKCQNFFCDPCWCICVDSSLYTVGAKGAYTYTACGHATHL
jgi:hypothetical protein